MSRTWISRVFFIVTLSTLIAPDQIFAQQSQCPSGPGWSTQRESGGIVYCVHTDGPDRYYPVDPSRATVTCGGGQVALQYTADPRAPSGQRCHDAVTGEIDPSRGTPLGTVNPQEISCAGKWEQLTSPIICLMRWAFSWIGSAFIWLGVTFATIAGSIFEATVKYTIVEFGYYLNNFLKEGIDQGWTALRDIANIVIIGLFVFIAINIILGVKEFGDKKKIAKVLIVAILINFSLLFTKVIVDASNFTAYHFYNSMVKGVGGEVNLTAQQIPGAQSARQTSTGGSGISGRFMQLLGVEGVAGTDKTKLRDIAETNKDALTALGYGFLSFILLIAVSFVLLYGAFLIISRAILIIFLMLTSALAFASWLIPQQYVEKGFSKWWESLLKAAFFAPILMALLWVTVIVSARLESALVSNGAGKAGVLGALATDPSGAAHILALLNFILVLGLLFASFATANAFSKSISGFKIAAAFPVLGLAGVSRVGRFAGRQTFGRVGKLTDEWLQAKSKDPGRSTFAKRSLDMLGEPFRKAATKDFDFMKTKLGNTFADTAGYKGSDLAGRDLKGFEGAQKEFLKRQTEAAERMAMPKDKADEVKEEGVNTALRADPELAQEHGEAYNKHEDAKAHEKNVRDKGDERLAELGENIRGLQTAVDKSTEEHRASVGSSDEGVKQAAMESAKTKLEEGQDTFRQEAERIKRARAAAAEATRASAQHFERIKERSLAHAKTKGYVPKNVDETKEDIAKKLVKGSLTALILHTSKPTPAGLEDLAKRAAKEMGKKEKKEKVKNSGIVDLLEDIRKEGDKKETKSTMDEKKTDDTR